MKHHFKKTLPLVWLWLCLPVCLVLGEPSRPAAGHEPPPAGAFRYAPAASRGHSEPGRQAGIPTPPPPAEVAGLCPGTGSLWREQWDNAVGNTVASIPLGAAASSAGALNQFELSGQGGTNYGARLRAYVCPPQSGTYTFFLAGDDEAELYLSSDEDPAHRQRIATCAGWLNGPHDFQRYASQQSAAVSLVAGQRYYMEALHKQGWGPGFVAVAWRLPDGSRQEPMPGSALIPFTPPTPLTFASPVTGPVTSTKARITFTFASPPASASARIAPLLFNKTRVLQFEEDDSPGAIYTDAYPIMKGGTASNGQTYPGLRFSDGCGNSRAYTGAVAINGHNPYNNSVGLDPGPQHVEGGLLWTQAQELLDNGWDIENHSDLHTADNPPPAQQVANLDGLIADRLRGYKPTVLVVPTNFAGYPTAAFNAGYIAVSSQSQSDGLPMFNPYNGNRVPLSTLPLPATRFVYQRYGADLDRGAGETNDALQRRLNQLSDDLMAPSSPASEVYVQRVFAHVISPQVLGDWLSYTQRIAQDQVWVTTLREFSEYRRLRSEVVKTETLSGNTLTVDLDYAAMSPNTRFQSLSLLVDSPGTITDITVVGASGSSFNKGTKLVNIFRQQVATGSNSAAATLAPPPPPPPAPAPAPAPTPAPTNCSGTGSILREQWNDVAGTSVGNTPYSATPSSTSILPQFELLGNSDFNYGARVRGYLCPPQSGAYTFFITGDDEAELWLSTDDNWPNRVHIASIGGWLSGSHDWTRYASQQSDPINLKAGQRYYIEALHKQGWGPGYVSVAWKMPDGSVQGPIAGSSLIPYGVSDKDKNKDKSKDDNSLMAAPTAPEEAVRTSPKLLAYPNPFTRQTTVQFSLASAGPASLAIYSSQGQLVRQLFAGPVPAGVTQRLSIEAQGLSSGVYVLRLVTDKNVLTQKLVLTK